MCSYHDGQTYRNRRCSSCNGVTNVRLGTCDATAGGPNTITGCTDTSHRHYESCMVTGGPEPVCWGDTDYWNHFCALCAGANPADVQYSTCGTPDTMVSTCVAGESTTACYNYAANPVCIGHNAYRNSGCARCNRVDTAQMSPGACDNHDPCHSVDCTPNAHCSLSVLDCGFDFATSCNWTVTGGAAAVMVEERTEQPTLDHTFGDATYSHVAGFMTLGGSAGAPVPEVTSPTINTSTVGTAGGCSVVFWLWSPNPTMGLHVLALWRFSTGWQAAEVWDSASVARGTGWVRYQVSLADVYGN